MKKLTALIGLWLIVSTAALAQVPTVVTGTGSNATVNSFMVRGFVDANGVTTFAWFNWGGTPTNLNHQTSTNNIGNGTTSNLVVATLTPLLDGTRYWFQVVASNANGTVYGLIDDSVSSPVTWQWVGPDFLNVNQFEPLGSRPAYVLAPAVRQLAAAGVDLRNTLFDPGTTSLKAKLLNELSVVNYGALGNGTNDDTAAIQSAITAAAVNGGGIVFLPATTNFYRTTATIFITNSNVRLAGAAVNASQLICDLAVNPAIQVGTFQAFGSTTAVYHVGIEQLTVGRAAGTPNPGTVGVLWDCFNYCYESQVRLTHHDFNQQITGPGTNAVSIGFTADHMLSDSPRTTHLHIDNVAEVKFTDSFFGSNLGDAYDCLAMIIIAGGANDIAFDNVNLVPRGPSVSPPGAVLFAGYVNQSGGFAFRNCNTENTSVGFTSDSLTPLIQDFAINGGRWANSVGAFNIDMATRLKNVRITGGAEFSADVTINNPFWLTIGGGCYFGGPLNLTGGTNAIPTNAIAVVTGNIFNGNVTLQTSIWSNLVFTGNAVMGTFTDNATGKKVVADNGN